MAVNVASLPGGDALVLKQDRTGSFSRQDGYSVGQDGKNNQQAVEIHARTASRRAEPQYGCRFVEGW